MSARYPDAAKGNPSGQPGSTIIMEQTDQQMTEKFIDVAPVEALSPGQHRAFDVDGENILLCAVEDKFYAVANMCTHAASTLQDGRQRGCFILCPLHGARFDVRTGQTDGKLTRIPLKIYEVRVADGRILIGLPALAPAR